MKYSLLAAGALLAGNALAAVDPIVIKGSKFFYKTNGTEFYIRGVAYQEPVGASGNFTDPLADVSACQRDIPYLVKLRTNTIRVYGVDPTLDHSECMNALADVGIYTIIDLGSPQQSINRNSPSWDISLYNRYTAVIDAFANYTNVLGFFAGNEVSNSVNTTAAMAFVKAAVRDSKAYIKSKGYRQLGVGYAAADVADIRTQLADYLNCDNTEDSIDFFGDNVYEWCGDSATFQTSGYSNLVQDFQNYSVPYFFAEYGCITVQPRAFNNIPVMYGPDMENVLNGGIVYEYFQDTNDFGLVTIEGNAVSTLAGYSSLSKEIASATPTGVNSASYTPTNTALQACPTVDANWQASPKLPPTPNQELCNCMVNSLTCVLKDSVDSSEYGKLFGQVCGYGVCAGITANATTGTYGAYSMCEASQQLSFVMNEYYQQQVAKGNGDSACDFGGAASTKAAVSPTGTCATLINEAGAQGTGSVTSSPTGGAAATGSTSSGAAFHVAVPASVSVGSWQLGAYIMTAVLSGMGMILL
ncbi:hypothetical protein VTN77DRAFT_2753 [Rasamsonia byssochlamydoides]|uniref:uncharacterized protein n=1 Tax=Rasamsonia byssochlamydoides TaxID=89139 RepID=UPI00374426A0